MNEKNHAIGFGISKPEWATPASCLEHKEPISLEDLLERVESGEFSFLTYFRVGSDETVRAIQTKTGLPLQYDPKSPKQPVLNFGDLFVIIKPYNLRQIPKGERYTDREIEEASYTFTVYRILEIPDV